MIPATKAEASVPSEQGVQPSSHIHTVICKYPLQYSPAVH